MDLELFSALGMWAKGESVSSSYLYGIKIIWLGRIGKVMMASCLLVTIIDLYGPNRIRFRMLRALVVARGYRKYKVGKVASFHLLTLAIFYPLYAAFSIINAIAPKLAERLTEPVDRWIARIGSFIDRRTETAPGAEKYAKRAHAATEGVSGIFLVLTLIYVVSRLDKWFVSSSWWMDILVATVCLAVTLSFFMLWALMQVALASFVVRVSHPITFALSDVNLRRKTMLLTALLFVAGFAMDMFAS